MKGIYKITNPEGKIYIGKSKNIYTRFLNHKSRKSMKYWRSKLTNSYDTYGFNNHKFEIIFECDEEYLLIYEAYFINKYNSIENGLNTAAPNIDISIIKKDPIEIEMGHIKDIKKNHKIFKVTASKEEFKTIKKLLA